MFLVALLIRLVHSSVPHHHMSYLFVATLHHSSYGNANAGTTANVLAIISACNLRRHDHCLRQGFGHQPCLGVYNWCWWPTATTVIFFIVVLQWVDVFCFCECFRCTKMIILVEFNISFVATLHHSSCGDASASAIANVFHLLVLSFW